MDLQIGKILIESELDKCEHITTFGTYEIYLLNEEVSFLFAINNRNLICSCFEFASTYDGMQLAHMYTLEPLKGQGIGKLILREAVKLWTVFDLPSEDTSQRYYFIEDGLGWTRHCFDIGILSQPPFKQP